VHRNGFEGDTVQWAQGQADAPFRETAHRITDQTAYLGKRAELIELEARAGNYIYYTYNCPRAALSEDYSVTVWLKADRPGVQLLARLVLPRELDPGNLDQPVTMLLPGDTYQLAGGWQRLDLRAPVKVAEQQQKILQAQLKRPLSLSDAFVDRVVLNLYAGPGPMQVLIDELELGPVAQAVPALTTSLPGTSALRPGATATLGIPAVRWDHDQLLIGGRRAFFRAIRHTDTPLRVLRDAGFTAVVMDEATADDQIEEAVRLGLRVVPVLPVYTGEGRLVSGETLAQRVSRFPRADGVLFWSLGAGGLAQDQLAAVAHAADTIRVVDNRPLAADVWESFQAYSRSVDLLGVHRWPLMTSLELPQYQQWLNQRRLLAQPDTFLWTWVQTHLPDWYVDLIYKRPSTAGFDEPVGPQPEQIRLMAYTALGAGCRGLGFWSDRFLADSHQGQDRLLELALLNQELQLLEPFLTSAKPPVWIDTNAPEVKAAVFRCDRGVLVLPMWVGPGTQYVAGRAAVANLTLTVPEVPNGTPAWLVSPVGMNGLQPERVASGMRVVLPEFDVTAAIVFTADTGPNGLLVYLQDQTRRMKRQAAQWSKDLAARELDKVTRVETEIAQVGHQVRSAPSLLEEARKRLQACKQYWGNAQDEDTYYEAKRVLRPLRVLMRLQWEDACRQLNVPAASPYATSFFTLPRHWQFAERLRQTTPASNVLPNGDFEVSPDSAPPGWTRQEVPSLDEVTMEARRVNEAVERPAEGHQCLMLSIQPKNRGEPIEALERTFLAINSPDVHLPPGTLVQVSAWVRIPQPLKASVDGAMLYDSAGDAALAVRLTGPTKWTKFTLYREVPASGKLHVTIALTAIGTAYFDDIRIEPLVPRTAAR
jgi:hypothetical protein